VLVCELSSYRVDLVDSSPGNVEHDLSDRS
jgi:hypothetical protein